MDWLLASTPAFINNPVQKRRIDRNMRPKTCYRGRKYLLLLPTSKHTMKQVQVNQSLRQIFCLWHMHKRAITLQLQLSLLMELKTNTFQDYTRSVSNQPIPVESGSATKWPG